MSKNAKYEFFSRMNPKDVENKIIYILRNKFYNLWMNKFEWTATVLYYETVLDARKSRRKTREINRHDGLC